MIVAEHLKTYAIIEIMKKNKNIHIIGQSFLLFVVSTSIIVGLECLQKQSFCNMELGELFSGLAFAATITMFYAQSTIMILQQVENTFFLMLGQWRDVAKSVEFGQNWFRGRAVFKDLCDRINVLYKKKFVRTPSVTPEMVCDEFKEVNREEYQLLENYFSIFIRLLDFIDAKSRLILTKKKKKEFVDVLSAQLSSYEQRMLLYHFFIGEVSDMDKEVKCLGKKLIHKYEILKPLELETDKEDILSKAMDKYIDYKTKKMNN